MVVLDFRHVNGRTGFSFEELTLVYSGILDVFARLKGPVEFAASEQTPEYADIRLTGHDGGHFLLVRTDVTAEQPNVSKGADALDRTKKQCSELGFAMGKVEHGQCVMKLFK